MKITFVSRLSPSTIGEGIPDSAVLFVHGLGGSYWTWGKFSTQLKESWRGSDVFALEYDEYYLNQGWFYDLPLIRLLRNIFRILTGPKIDNLSQHLKNVVGEVCRPYDHVIIVAHSMGGLVARKFIINELKTKKSVGKVRALITYGTPHTGSPLADWYILLKYIYPFGKSKQIVELRTDSPFIKNLNDEWRNLRVEDKIDFKRIVALGDWIVPRSSAGFEGNEDNLHIDATKDHFTVHKPYGPKDPSFLVTYNYLKEFKAKISRKQAFDESNELNDENM